MSVSIKGDVNIMSCWSKEELENMLEDVVNELNLSDASIKKHGPMGILPAELVRLVLEQKDRQIFLLKNGFKQLSAYSAVVSDAKSKIRL